MKIHSTIDNLEVIYEDNHLIVINKKAGDLVQGDKTQDIPLSEIVKAYLKKKIQQTRKRLFRCGASFRSAHFWSGTVCQNLQSFTTA